jgi:hypothetical protein
MYYPDLSPYQYGELPDGCAAARNVGWLDSAEPYTRGPVPNGFAECLADLVENTLTNLTRGYHACDFCLAEIRGEAAGAFDAKALMAALRERAALGNGEVVVTSADGSCLVAPALVLHYVERHGYRPPNAFVEAVMAR